MEYRYYYESYLGKIILSSDGEYLTGLWFEGYSDDLKHKGNFEIKKLPVFYSTIKWLDLYFSGINPSFKPKYKIVGSDFRKEVINIIEKIPYGQVVSYGAIAKEICKKRGIKKMSAQAVGGAVGWNPICLIIPCHRVVGSNGNLVGYGSGINNKIKLLELEGIDISKYYLPK